MSSRNHIVVENLCKTFFTGRDQRQTAALSHVNLTVSEGQFVSLLGPSGCGKSTLLRIIGGLIEPTEGQVLVGDGTGPHAAQRAKEIGFVFQDPGLLAWKTVAQNIDLPLRINRKARRPLPYEREELLGLVGLKAFADAYPHQLSGGMQQRVAIARALVFDPGLLLMDEPFGALDAITRRTMRYELLRIWIRSQKTVLFVTHSIAEAIVLSDVVVVLSPRPARVLRVVKIDLQRPRTKEIERSPEFLGYTDRFTQLLEIESES